jgi:SAM-dependent methyltransferase
MKDNFSAQAKLYSRYRPTYPPELFDFLLSLIPARENAWDCATGNGQTAVVLASYFTTVHATDISQQQLDQAPILKNIIYSRQPAEQTSFEDNSFDLVTVSQALHWIHFDQFYKELSRVARNGCLFSAWTYSLLTVQPDMDELIADFYKKTLAGYWDRERQYVDEEYRTIPFPYKKIPAPQFHIRISWSLQDLSGYISSWSAVQKYIKVNGISPVDALMEKLSTKWKDDKLQVSFPLYMIAGKISK